MDSNIFSPTDGVDPATTPFDKLQDKEKKKYKVYYNNRYGCFQICYKQDKQTNNAFSNYLKNIGL